MFQLLCYTLERLSYTEKVVSWESKGLSAENLTTPTTTYNNSLSPSIKWYKNSKFCLIFQESCFKKKNRKFFSSKCNTFSNGL